MRLLRLRLRLRLRQLLLLPRWLRALRRLRLSTCRVSQSGHRGARRAAGHVNTRRRQKEEPVAHGDVVKHKRGAERHVFGELWNAGVLDATDPLMAVSQMHLEHALLRGQPVWRSALLVSDRHVPQMLDLHNVRPHEHGLMQICHACRQRRTSGCSSHEVATRARGQRRPATRNGSGRAAMCVEASKERLAARRAGDLL